MKEMRKNKTKIYLAGDSTVSTYQIMEAPQAGWGQMLYKQFLYADKCICYHPKWSQYSQVTCYELPEIEIINCAMAGRSSRSFREEGRLQEIDQRIQEGDYLFVQFAHNDANKEKKERYVPIDAYAESLNQYRNVCRKHGAILVLVTAIAMRDDDNYNAGEKHRFSISFPAYRAEMIRYAADKKLILLDLGEATTRYLNTLTIEETKSIYLWAEENRYQGKYQMGVADNAHLSEYGSNKYASILAELIKNHKSPLLDSVRRNLL